MPGDYAQAVVWYRKAADQGDADAQTLLGMMYDHGHGVPQDYAQAVVWFERPPSKGTPGAGQPRHAVRQRPRRGTGLCSRLICGSTWQPEPQAHRTPRLEDVG